MNVIGIDIGGTKIVAGIVNDSGDIIRKIETHTPVESGGEGILARIKEVVLQLQGTDPTIGAIGIGSAGRIDRSDGSVRYATDNLPGWMGVPLKEVMETTFSLPVFVDNDVNTAALGEGWLGVGRGKEHYILVTLGTGVGGALVHGGNIIDGPLGGAGEIGHMILYPHGIQCNCGQIGCFEQYASGTALNRLAQRLNPNWDSRELMTQVAQHNKQATEGLVPFIDDLSIGLISLYNIYDPDLIILGGGVIDSRHLWWDKLEEAVNTRTTQTLSLAPAALGNLAGMLGAARFAYNETMR